MKELKQIKKLITIDGVSEYVLENGLRLLTIPDMSQSVFTLNIIYLTGSKDESIGESGIAHILEHMLFKKTKKYRDIKGELQKRGANFNASTWFDRTSYYETLSSSFENLKFAISLERERMKNAVITKKDLSLELGVIKNELEMAKSDLVGELHDRVLSSAYTSHSYRNPTIGDICDIENMSVSKMKKFYRTHYGPSNATIIISGNFDETEAIKLINEEFEGLRPGARKLDISTAKEMPQEGPREISIEKITNTSFGALAYHIPSGCNEDFPFIRILLEVLVSETSGKLYRSFVKKGQASEIFGSAYSLMDPSVFMVFSKPEAAENAVVLNKKIAKAIENIKEKSITEKDIKRAKFGLLKKIKYVKSSSKGLSLALTEAISTGDWRLFFWFENEVKKAKKQEVIHVAEKYLIKTNRTSGVILPVKKTHRAVIPLDKGALKLLDSIKHQDTAGVEEFNATIENIEKSTNRFCISNNEIKISILTKPTRENIVYAKFVFKIGNERFFEKHGPDEMQITAEMLTKGCIKYNAENIKDKLNSLNSSIITASGLGCVSLTIISDQKNINEVIFLLSDIMHAPTIKDKELEIAQKRSVANFIEMQDDPRYVSLSALRIAKNPWKKKSVHYVPTTEEHINNIKAISVADVKEIHNRTYGAENLEISMLGLINENTTPKVIESCFGNWKSKEKYERIGKPFKKIKDIDVKINIPEKEMAFVVAATNFQMQDNDPNYEKMLLVNHILGESAKSKLTSSLREKEGISYASGSWIEISQYEKSSSISLYAMCAPKNAEKTCEIMIREFTGLAEKEIDNAELILGKSSFIQGLEAALSNNNFLINQMSSDIALDRKFDRLEILMEKISNMKSTDIRSFFESTFRELKFAKVKSGTFDN